MDVLMSETCWAHKKWNKTASDIKFVSYSSTILHVFNDVTEAVSPRNFVWFLNNEFVDKWRAMI